MQAKYKDVAMMIEDNIINGKYDITGKLPTVDELIKEFEVSRNTIRTALELLVNNGYIYQVQGSGIFVRQTCKEGYINISNMRGLTKDLEDKKIETKILKFDVTKADEEMAEKMKCKVGTELYYVKRLRIVDGTAFSVEDSFFNKEIITYLNSEIVENSIYEYVTNALKYTIGFADKVICCEKLQEQEAELLGLEELEGTLVIENRVYLSNGLIFDVSRAKYNYKNTKFISVANYK